MRARGLARLGRPASAGAAGSNPVQSVLRSGGARLLVVPISALLGIVNTRLIISHWGEQSYAQYGLLVGIQSLLPFADLGVSAAVMNAIGASDDPRHDSYVRKVLTTALRVLFGSMVVLALTALVMLAGGWWGPLLGDGLIPGSGPTVAAICLVIIALGMPIGFGQRVMAGVGRNHVNVLLTGLQTPVVLTVLLSLAALHLGGNGSIISAVPYAVTFGLTGVICFLAARQIRPMVGLALRDSLRIRTVRGGGVFAVAWPTLVQMVALPIAMQTDRLVLSHVSTLSNLAEYNLASQMFTPVWGVVNAAGVALWPIFAKARAKGDTSTSPTRLALGFGAAAAFVCAAIGLASPWLADKASGGVVSLGWALVVSFAVLMILQAVKFPLGMYMTDPPGLRYQALMIVLLLPVNLGLSWVLAIHIGAAGPVIGSAIGVFLCQVLANWVYVRRDLARRRALPSAAAREADAAAAVEGEHLTMLEDEQDRELLFDPTIGDHRPDPPAAGDDPRPTQSV